MGRSLKTVPELTQELIDRKSKDGHTAKLYNEKGAAIKADALRTDISRISSALSVSGQVDLNDLDQVKEQTLLYLEACQNAAACPSMMGLSVAFGMTRQNLYRWLKMNPGKPTTAFIQLVQEAIADVVANGSMSGSINAVMGIFVLKNCHGFSDKVELEQVRDDNDTHLNEDELIKKYHFLAGGAYSVEVSETQD